MLGRSGVWDGLVLKANNALPFVPSMTFCEVTSRLSDTVFDRDIEIRGESWSNSGRTSRWRAYARLGRVKAQYDPGNLFRANYNIVPQPAP